MKKALINPLNTNIYYVSSWAEVIPVTSPVTYTQNYTSISNSCEITEVSDSEFEVALPLFWVDCEDNVTPEEYYYNTSTELIMEKPADEPDPDPFIPTDE